MAITKALREGILKVGAKRAGKLENEVEHDEWFSSIGHAPMADLFRLYSKVCHHYLVPLLSQVPLDSSLFKRDNSYNNSMAPPETVADKNGEDGSENSKENMDPLMMDLQVCEGLIDTILCEHCVTNFILPGHGVRTSSNSVVHDRSLQLRCGQLGAGEAIQHGAGPMLQ